MKSLFISKIILVLIISLCSCLIFLASGMEKKTIQTRHSQETEQASFSFRVKGLSGIQYNAGQITTCIEAEEIKVSPRKYFIFNIKPFKEAIIKNAKISLYLQKDTHEKEKKISFSDNYELPFNTKEMGLVTRGIIKGLIVEIHREDRPGLIIKAKKAKIDLKKKKIRLFNAVITDIASQKQIVSNSIIWSDNGKVFRIPGSYYVLSPDGKQTGKGIIFDLDSGLSVHY